MAEEPDIIKQLRDAEKLGLVQSKMQSEYEEVESVDQASENIWGETVAFSEDEDQKINSNEKYSSIENLEFIKSILDAIDDGIYIVDNQGNIQYINPVIRREFGPVNNKKCYEYFHNRTKRCPWCKNKEIFAGKSVHWEWYSSKSKK